MSAHRKDIDTNQRIQITAKMLQETKTDCSALATTYQLSRTSIYNIAKSGREVLEKNFSKEEHTHRKGLGFWVWVDANTIKRLIVSLRVICGATFSMIAQILPEALGIRISESTIRNVCIQAYQLAFEYQQSISLTNISRIALDEMFRWKRCLLTGVDCDSLFIFLNEKQRGRGYLQWKPVLNRLQEERDLNPQQIAMDGWGPLQKSSEETWKDARIVHDINHLRRIIDAVRVQFEKIAYQKIKYTQKHAIKKSFIKHPEKLVKYKEQEEQAVEKAEQVAILVSQAQESLNIINSKTGLLNTTEESLSQLQSISNAFKELNTYQANITANYIMGVGSMIVKERVAFDQNLKELEKHYHVPLSALQKAAFICQLNKHYQATKWMGTKEELMKQKLSVWKELKQEIGDRAPEILKLVTISFYQILAASSPVEWAHSRIGAVLSPQKRVSSGFLCLRVAYLNLHSFDDGLRKGKSPHELLTSEKINDWLGFLGYSPRNQKLRTFKKLGWPRLVKPFEITWRQNWIDTPEENMKKPKAKTPLSYGEKKHLSKAA